MKDSSAEEYVLKSVNEINDGSKYNYIDQFGYNYNGETISVTLGAVSDFKNYLYIGGSYLKDVWNT